MYKFSYVLSPYSNFVGLFVFIYVNRNSEVNVQNIMLTGEEIERDDNDLLYCFIAY